MVRNTVDKDPKRRKQLLGMFRPIIAPLHRVENELGGHSGNYKNYVETAQLPRPMFANGTNFDYVGSQDGTTPFIFSPNPTFDRFAQADKYTSQLSHYGYNNLSIQVYRNQPPAVRVDYIPANFREYAIFEAGCCGNMCDWDNEEYLMPGDILQLVIQSIMIEIRQPAIPENHPREEVQVEPGK